MFTYKNYQETKQELFDKLDSLKKKEYHIQIDKTPVYQDLSIDKITILSQLETKRRVVLSIGLHGIEGYVGHACVMAFLDIYLPKLKKDTEVIIYHPLNPFGMKHYRRQNENNVDLNRNFTQNNFQSENLGYETTQTYFLPRKYKNNLTANFHFYLRTIGLILKHGIPTIKEATLKGQKVQKNGLYYSGNTVQNTTKYILEETPKLLHEVDHVIWIDLHTGYGPRYQMSIVNSKYEKVQTQEQIKSISYPIILGIGEDDFYDIDGDMIEMIYRLNQNKTDLYATCFEFGTLGDSTLKTMSSLKAMMFENASHFATQNQRFHTYSNHLIKEQFMPQAERWRNKALEDFKHAMSDILKWKKFL